MADLLTHFQRFFTQFMCLLLDLTVECRLRLGRVGASSALHSACTALDILYSYDSTQNLISF